jgi:integrase
MQEKESVKNGQLVKTGTPGIYKRGTRYVVVFRDLSGRQRKRFTRTLAEARDLKATLTADVKRGEFRAFSRVTFADYAKEWIEQYSGRTRHGLRTETRADYRRALGLDRDGTPLGNGAVAFFGRMRLTEIEPRDVKRYATEVGARGVSANTVRLALAPVKALLATAVEEGLIRSNPAAGLRFVRPAGHEEVSEARVKALTPAELRALIAEVPEGWRLLAEFLSHTGLRISEALALTWADVDFGERRVRVRRRLYRGKIGPTKSEYGRRDVALTVNMAQQLWRARGAAPETAHVFAAKNGALLDRSHVFRVVKAAGKRAGVPWAGLHTLRHTAATLAFANGWNAKQVQRLLGHHSASFTLDTYVHLLPGDVQAPDHMDGIIRSEVEPSALRCDDRVAIVLS